MIQDNLMVSVLWIIIAYLSGSIPFGLLLTRGSDGRDIRQIGSGNIGATNVLRTRHTGLAFITLCLDMLKGALPVALSLYGGNCNKETLYVVGLSAVLGHVFPLWLRFSGGKGVATALGVCLVVNFYVGLLMVAVWLGIAMIVRISSLAALGAFIITPVITVLKGEPITTSAFYGGLMLLILWTHRSNIKRLLQGKEELIRL